MKVKLLPLLFFSLFTCVYPQNDFWQKVSSADAGNSISMTIDSLGYIYNGTSDRGIFQSTDLGLSWHNLDLGFTSAKIIKVRVTQDGSIIAATTNYGILISRDNSKTWSQINGALSPTDIFTISSSPNYLLAGTSNGLFKSSDGGKNWTADTSFAGLKVIEVENIQGMIFCYSVLGIQKKVFSTSSDGGKTWTKAYLGHEGFSYQTAAFAFDKVSGRVYCASSYSPYNGIGRVTFSSSDNGKTWSEIDPKGKLINSLLADSSGILFAACSGDGIIKSTDWGISWQNISTGISNPFVGSIISDTKGYFYAGTTSGVMVSGDHGLSWKEISKGLNSSPINGFISDQNGNLYASSRVSIYRSKDEGVSWAPIMNGIAPGAYGTLREVKNYVFISSTTAWNTQVYQVGYKFYPDSNAWSKINIVVEQTGVDPKGRIYSLYSFFTGLYMENSLYASSNGGDTWSTLTTFVSIDRDPPFAVDPSKGIIYILSGGKLSKSSNDGKTWVNTNYARQNLIKLRSNSKGYLFAMPDSFTIVRSKDEGNTWQDIKNNLTLSAGISEIYFDNKDRVFLLASDGHVYFSNTLGDSWINITENLPLSGGSIFAIALSPNSDVFAAKTSGEIYKITDLALSSFDSVENPKSMPGEYSLGQNYPNPFNPRTTIFYSIPYAGNVNISLFDALGNKVAELVNEYKSEGIFKVDFDGKGFTSGVYFYRIQSGNYAETKKLMLLK